jgi:hypothetical protein
MEGYVKGVHTFNNVVFSGTHAPGLSPAAVSGGNVTYSDSATLVIELGGTTAGSEFDQINSDGTVNLDGTLEVALINNFDPLPGQTFDIITSNGTIDGTFDTELMPDLYGGLFLDIEYSSSAVTLLVEGVLGDFNFDGSVDAADYVVWRKGLGTTYTPADYDVWRANFGATASSGTGAMVGAAVPEPATPVILLLEMLLMCARRRGAES